MGIEMGTGTKDIVRLLRSVPANMLGSEFEDAYWLCHDAAAEIERLRTIMYRVVDEDCTVAIQNGTFYADDEPLFSVPCTPPTHTTPGKGSVQNEGTVNRADCVSGNNPEIECLRGSTAEERMAVAWAVSAASNDEHPAEDILRGLLERMK